MEAKKIPVHEIRKKQLKFLEKNRQFGEYNTENIEHKREKSE